MNDLKTELMELGYNEDFCNLCVKSLVTKEMFIEQIVDILRDTYYNAMQQVEDVSEELKEFISYSLITAMKDFTPHLAEKPYSGFSILDGYRNLFAIYGGIWFVIFGSDEETAVSDNVSPSDNVFHDVIDWILSHEDIKEKIRREIENFN